jgi:peptide/nickel transport system substrate-binding protein
VSRLLRLPGVVVTVGLLAGVYWYGCRPDAGPASRTPVAGTPARGGELVASVRSEPRSFNRIATPTASAELLNLLTQARLLRVNRTTQELEPRLAEAWESSPDGLVHTLRLRPGVKWSDGTAFSASDVAFSVQVATDPAASAIASSLRAADQPITAAAVDELTVRVTFAGPFGPGVGLLDSLPIVPRHKLERAYADGAFKNAWSMQTPPADVVGLGPFVFTAYEPGQRLVLSRNPHYWRVSPDGKPLPYLDRLVLEVVPDQNAELLRLQAGAADLLQDEIRSEDYVALRRADEAGSLKLVELGVSPGADGLWFCLKPSAKKSDPRFAFVQRAEFRQALSHAVDREAFAQTVFLGAAVPVWGPVTPGNKEWFSPNLPRYPYDIEKAKALLAGIGLTDRDGDGTVEDAQGHEARFSIIAQRGLGWNERGLAVIKEQAAKVGIGFDIVFLEFGAMMKQALACDFDAVYMRILTTSLDPANNLDFWLSSGSAHLWNLEQKTPATEWEAQLDALMRRQAASLNPAERRTIFEEAQRLFAQHLPVIYFAAPRIYTAHSARLRGAVPSVQRPPVLWNADSLSVAGPPPAR